MLRTLFHPKPLNEPAHTRTVLSYSQEELALLLFKAFVIQYRVRTGDWPAFVAQDAEGRLAVQL
jgi:hypothetical protein